MNSQLKQPLVLTAIGATLAVAVVYAAVPLFSIPLFGFGYGWEYVATFFKVGKYLEMVPFLMPFIGLAGTAATLVTKSRGAHVLSISFAALPLMFFGYFVYMIASYPQGDIIGAGMEKISILSTLSWSVWACLALSLAAFAVAVANVYKENKNK